MNRRQGLNRALPRSLNCVLPRSLNRTLPRSLNCVLPRSLNCHLLLSLNRTLPRSLNCDLLRSLNRTLPRSLNRTLLRSLNCVLLRSLNRTLPRSLNCDLLRSLNRALLRNSSLVLPRSNMPLPRPEKSQIPETSRGKIANAEPRFPSSRTRGSPWVFVRCVAVDVVRLHRTGSCGRPLQMCLKTERAARQQGSSFLRENSSNGGKTIRTFWLHSRGGGGSVKEKSEEK